MDMTSSGRWGILDVPNQKGRAVHKDSMWVKGVKTGIQADKQVWGAHQEAGSEVGQETKLTRNNTKNRSRNQRTIGVLVLQRVLLHPGISERFWLGKIFIGDCLELVSSRREVSHPTEKMERSGNSSRWKLSSNWLDELNSDESPTSEEIWSCSFGAHVTDSLYLEIISAREIFIYFFSRILSTFGQNTALKVHCIFKLVFFNPKESLWGEEMLVNQNFREPTWAMCMAVRRETKLNLAGRHWATANRDWESIFFIDFALQMARWACLMWKGLCEGSWKEVRVGRGSKCKIPDVK